MTILPTKQEELQLESVAIGHKYYKHLLDLYKAGMLTAGEYNKLHDAFRVTNTLVRNTIAK